MNNVAESKEAQELFFELGYEWNGSGKEVVSWRIGLLFTKEFQGKNCLCYFDKDEEAFFGECIGEELTLPQLRDLVVLHRNDVKDANWVTEGDDQIYKDSNGKSFIFREQGWDELQRHEMRQAMWEKIKPKPQPTEHEQGLISGADAKLAWAKGENIQVRPKTPSETWEDLSGKHSIDIFEQVISYEFRLKPRTIKLELEIPACGKNYKHGQLVWVLNSLEPKEYCSVILDESDELPAYWWETEKEIKQVVEALRGGIKG